MIVRILSGIHPCVLIGLAVYLHLKLQAQETGLILLHLSHPDFVQFGIVENLFGGIGLFR